MPRSRTRCASAGPSRARGLAGHGVFEDRAISGASTDPPGYQRAGRCLAGKPDVVLAEALDRLSRDQEDIAGLYKRLRFLGVQLVTVSEGEVGDLHIGFKGAMNAMYLKDLADKTRRGLEGRVGPAAAVAASAMATTWCPARSAAAGRSSRASRNRAPHLRGFRRRQSPKAIARS